MTFKVSILLTANGKQAKSELVATGKNVDQLSRKLRKMGVNSNLLERELQQLAAAERAAAKDADGLNRANRSAAGSLSNLTAQFNDLGVMMAAGQNPLQLALQQGTQITQVIGPMGAAGAVNALGSAFMSMINPINLVTIGSIAAGAAIFQWLTNAGEEAKDLKDLIQQTSDALDAFDESAGLAGLGAVDMKEKFGTIDPVLKDILVDLNALKKIDLYRSLAEQAEGVRDLVLDLSFWDERSSQSAAQDFLGLNSISKSARRAGVEFAKNLEILRASEDPSVKLKAALDLKQQLLDAAGGLEALNLKQEEFYNGLAATIRDLILIGAKVDEVSQAPNENFRALASLWQDLKASATDYIQMRVKEEEAARSSLAGLRERAEIQQAILEGGADSVRVIELRQQAERRAFEQMLATKNISEDLKKEMRENFDLAQKFERLNLSAGVSSAAGEAKKLAEWLGISLETAVKIDRLGPQGVPSSSPIGGRGEDPAKHGGSLQDWANRDAIVFLENWRSRKTKPGGGKSSIDKEREAVKRLTQRLKDQLDILRATDPVQKELLRNREALKGATEAERTAVKNLIAERIKEEEALRQIQESQEWFQSSGYDILDGLIFRGDSLSDAFDNAARAIAQAGLQAALLGSGPLAGLFGTGGSGGLLGALSGAILPAAAEGGYLTGPGDGTSDNILMWGSAGEFMVNAKATARYRHLLEAINSGVDIRAERIAAFADGGLITGTANENRHPYSDRRDEDRPGRDAMSGTVNHFHIKTDSPERFARSRASVSRGAGRVLNQAKRYS